MSPLQLLSFCVKIPSDVVFEADWGHEDEFLPDQEILDKIAPKEKPNIRKLEKHRNSKMPIRHFRNRKSFCRIILQ